MPIFGYKNGPMQRPANLQGGGNMNSTMPVQPPAGPQTFQDFVANGSLPNGTPYATAFPEGSVRFQGLQNRFNNMQNRPAPRTPRTDMTSFGLPRIPPNGYGKLGGGLFGGSLIAGNSTGLNPFITTRQ